MLWCAVRLEAYPPEEQALAPVQRFPHRTWLLELLERLLELLLLELLLLELLLLELPLPPLYIGLPRGAQQQKLCPHSPGTPEGERVVQLPRSVHQL